MQEKTNKWNTKLSPSRPNSKIWMKKLSTSIFSIQPWATDNSLSLLQTPSSLLPATFVGRILISLASMVMIQLDGYIRHNNTLICITLLMSPKSHLHHFIWNVKPFNGYVGTSRIMKSPNGQIFSNSFCTDLALVVLMNSQGEYQIEFEKSIKHTEGFSNAFYRSCFYHWS